MAKYYLGVDLGGTNIAAGIVNENGEILFRKSVKTNLPQPEHVIEEKICNLCLRLCGNSSGVEVIWDDITLQDSVEQARAELYKAQAKSLSGGDKND